jgi:D-Tyr-tRNAtyr deacylase
MIGLLQRVTESLVEVGGNVVGAIGPGLLVLVPQFTRAADTRKRTRPSFTPAAPLEEGKRLFEHLLACARETIGNWVSRRPEGA